MFSSSLLSFIHPHEDYNVQTAVDNDSFIFTVYIYLRVISMKSNNSN